jgi:DNA invertase Pin-like site-specific DNA recombinase
MVVMHSCDNPGCVNPAHLSVGTSGDNTRDAAKKGRMPSGARNGSAKLKPEQVERIRELYKQGGYTHAQLGRMFGVSKLPVGRILRGQSWRTENVRHIAIHQAPKQGNQ